MTGLGDRDFFLRSECPLPCVTCSEIHDRIHVYLFNGRKKTVMAIIFEEEIL
jgi:hypothetical protein